jgi:hypothetical protein
MKLEPSEFERCNNLEHSNSSVSVVTDYGLGERGSISGREGCLFSFHKAQMRIRSHLASCVIATG